MGTPRQVDTGRRPNRFVDLPDALNGSVQHARHCRVPT